MQGYALIERMAPRNRERVIQTKGYGAHGSFAATHDISQYTRTQRRGPGTRRQAALA